MVLGDVMRIPVRALVVLQDIDHEIGLEIGIAEGIGHPGRDVHRPPVLVHIPVLVGEGHVIGGNISAGGMSGAAVHEFQVVGRSQWDTPVLVIPFVPEPEAEGVPVPEVEGELREDDVEPDRVILHHVAVVPESQDIGVPKDLETDGDDVNGGLGPSVALLCPDLEGDGLVIHGKGAHEIDLPCTDGLASRLALLVGVWTVLQVIGLCYGFIEAEEVIAPVGVHVEVHRMARLCRGRT